MSVPAFLAGARGGTNPAGPGDATQWVWHARRVRAWDHGLFHQVARRHWPGAHPLLPKLSRAADHGRLWFAVAAGLAATRRPGVRRAAVRGVASLAVASATVNTLGKGAVRRARPLLDTVPVIRQLHRQPVTTSFPSGHSASAAAFATGVALESPRWGAVVAPLAAAVAFSRVYTGAHYPSDVLAGTALGVGAAFAVRGIAPTRSQLPAPARPLAEAPTLRRGKGMVVVANVSSGQRLTEPEATRAGAAAGGAAGTPEGVPAGVPAGASTGDTAGRAPERPVPPALEAVREALPEAEIMVADPRTGGLGDVLEDAAARAAALGGALGVYGGDGTVNTAAPVAVRHGLPLAVLPGGTYNHFAFDLGIETSADTCRAVAAGEAVAVDLARFTPAPGGPAGTSGYFLNTFSLGSYPELVRMRERWAPRIGAWPAGVLAALRVLHTAGPVEAGLGGRQRALWQLFVGNCSYRGLGLAPLRRHDLADGLLDIRVVPGGRWARSRLFAAALTSVVGRSPVHTAVRQRRLRITGIPPGTHLTYDGEVAEAPEELLLDKRHEALTVYRPLGHSA
ncbi:bifunctional phosphatase PAP2/diacylglycerol kinase family protein [Streptomyces sp. JJ36]|uniref:bifunctional phosphatase PAP2/diacylglycerol kinase family protein n=1 Tax=Streptomyces sp. JJ36 TaxID=2736645 RepID=UPI001F29AC0C|nr:phosphatase PAP2 family protein [Streptomyces sp. JJ36]MCF6525978.1 phosphatase PAP2 family protein [Streptomyces sp. JJ36]